MAVTPLAGGTFVYWIVNAKNIAGTSPWSSSKTFTVPSTVPVTPTSIGPNGSIATTTPTFTWNAVAYAGDYTLYNNVAGVPTSTTYTAAAAGCAAGSGICSVTPATPRALGTSVYWIVKANNSIGSSPWSAGKTFIVTTTPATPTTIGPSGNISSTTPTYSWNAVTYASDYTLYTSIAGVAKSTTYTAAAAGCSSGTGTCSVTPATPLAGGTFVYWIVNAKNVAGTSPWSSNKTFTVVVGTPPLAPTLVSPSGSVNTTTPTFTWNSAATATDYTLYTNIAGVAKSTTYTAAAAGCASGSGTCSVTPAIPLASGSDVYWIVNANNSGGASPWSSSRTFKVQ